MIRKTESSTRPITEEEPFTLQISQPALQLFVTRAPHLLSCHSATFPLEEQQVFTGGSTTFGNSMLFNMQVHTSLAGSAQRLTLDLRGRTVSSWLQRRLFDILFPHRSLTKLRLLYPLTHSGVMLWSGLGRISLVAVVVHGPIAAVPLQATVVVACLNTHSLAITGLPAGELTAHTDWHLLVRVVISSPAERCEL